MAVSSSDGPRRPAPDLGAELLVIGPDGWPDAAVAVTAARVATVGDACEALRESAYQASLVVAAALEPDVTEAIGALLASGPALAIIVVTPGSVDGARWLAAGAQEVIPEACADAEGLGRRVRAATARAQRVAQLAERARQHELLHANASEGYIVVDGDGRLLQGRSILLEDRPLEELDARASLRFIHERDRPRVRAAFTAVALTPGATAELEAEVVDAAGRQRWLEMTLSNLSHEPSVGGIVVNYWDITARRRAEQALAFNAALLDSVGQAVVAIDPSGVIVYWNQAATVLYGWSPEEAIGRPIGEILVTDDVEQSEAIVRAVAHGQAWSGESWVRGRHGPAFPVWATDTPVHDERGELIAVIGVSTDITDRKASEATLRHLSDIVESSTEAIFSRSNAGIVLTWNGGAERLFGFSAEEAIGRHISMIVPPERHQELRDITEKVSLGHAIERLETVRRRKDGREVEVLLSVSPLYGEGGEVVGASTVTHDITDRVLAVRERAAAEGRFEAAFLRSSFGMAIADLAGYPTAVNRAMCELLDREPDELLGRHWTAYGHPDDTSLGVAVGAEMQRGSDFFSDERRYLRPDGSTVWVQANVSLVRDGDEEPMYFMVQMQDITARKVMEGELQHRALHDDLTGLPNRALLNDRLDHALVAAGRSGRSTGVAFLDVDGFKHVNDALGHAVGDRLLVEVGHRLAASVRPADTVARFGGDEYVLVCEDVTIEAMTGLAGRITDAMALPFSVDGREVALHASLGITISRRSSDSQSLLSEADAAMYRAKELGRGRAAVFDESLRLRAAALLEGERALRAGIAAGELVAYYQPIVDIGTEEAIGVEALVRWHTAGGEVVLPSAFIPLAETSGLIVEVGELVLGQAASAVAGWNAANTAAPELWVSVNLSARQLIDTGLAGLVRSILEDSGLPPRLLHLEITETVVMEDIAQSILVLEELRSLGVKLSIDDFGTGYSSLSYLRQLPVDTLKIDRSFVRGLGDGSDDSSIVRAIVSLGHALGLRSLAEGVETRAQQRALAGLGCQLGQGYLWSLPLAPEAAAAWAGRRGSTPPAAN